MTNCPYELCLFTFDAGMQVVFNPQSRASCRISAETARQLLSFPNTKGMWGEQTIRIPPAFVRRPGPYSRLFAAMKLGVRVRIHKRVSVAPRFRSGKHPHNFIIYPAFGCNLRCRYCWNAQGTYGRSKMRMSHATALQTGQWIAGMINASKTSEESVDLIDFFGGEPLLAMDAFKTIVELTRAAARRARHPLKILLETNGLFLDRGFIGFCKANDVTLNISLDGPAANHDSMRIDAGQAGTHRRVAEAVRRVLKYHPNGLQIRATLMPPYDVFKAYAYFHRLGIPEKIISIARVTPGIFNARGVMRYNSALAWSANRGAWHRFLMTYLDCLKTGRHKLYVKSVFEALQMAISPELHPNIRPCGLGQSGPVVLPDGSIVPCYYCACDPEMTVGNTSAGVIPSKAQAVINKVWPLTVWSFARCRRCFARYLCGGPCYACNKAEQGAINRISQSACDINRETAISNLFLAALWQREDPQFVAKLKANIAKGKDAVPLDVLFAGHYLSPHGRRREP